MRNLLDFELDGRLALVGVIHQTQYGSLEQAVASLTVFSHPETVAQTGNRAVFPIIRDFARRGTTEIRDGLHVGLDDNKAPTDAFLWANQIKRRPPDLQFNHVHARSVDPTCYTNLANLCVSPAFLAKMTDTNQDIVQLLQYRAFDLYGWQPEGASVPSKPNSYDALVWCPPLPPVKEVHAALSEQVARRKDRTTRMIRQTGWLFGEPMV